MKFNEEQKELVALLPQDVKKYGLTDSAKLVLGQIIFMYGTDFAEENGFVFRSNEDLLNDTGIASKTTLLKAINQLVNKGLISTKRAAKGDRGTASEYVLNESVLQKCTIQDIDNQAFGKKCTIKCTNNCTIENQKCTIEIERKINDMELNIKELVEAIKELKDEIKDLKCTIEGQKCTTDSDTDSEKESFYKEKLIDEKQWVFEHEWNDDEELDFSDEDLMQIEGWGNALMASTNKTITSNNNEVMKATATNNNPSITQSNDWFGKWMNRINGLLDCYFSAKSKEGIQAFESEINQLLISISDKSNTLSLTDKQRSAVDAICNRYIALNDQKLKYLQGDNENAAANATISSNDSKNNSGGVAAATDIYSDNEWAMKVEEAFNTDQPQTTPKKGTQKPHERHSDDEWNDYVIARFAAAEKAENEAKKAASNQWQLDINTIPF